MKNKTLLTVGALAVLGVLAYKYFNKDKSKDTGYSNASGRTSKMASPMKCTRCRTVDGGSYVPRADQYPQCKFSAGERCLSNPV